MDKITPLIEYGHKDFGENKVQEALDKWSDVKLINQNIKLHLIGGLQTNKVKFAIRLFDYIHSVDSEKLAKKIADEQKKQNEKVKIFLQVNIGSEIQKFGIDKSHLGDLYSFCKSIELDVVGLMCIPPVGEPSTKYFKEMNDFFEIIEKKFNLEVVIALHPNCFIKNYSKFFSNRKCIKFNTARLVKSSLFVFSHASSTAINFAIIYRKPLIYIITDEMKNNYLTYKRYLIKKKNF